MFNNGFPGDVITHLAVNSGLRPILARRDDGKLNGTLKMRRIRVYASIYAFTQDSLH
jgi:hypothetical protein